MSIMLRFNTLRLFHLYEFNVFRCRMFVASWKAFPGLLG